MNETMLQKKLDRIREVIESQHLVCVSYLRDGASEVDLADVDAFIGAPLPPSLRAFLRQHDGLHVSGWSHGEGEPVQLLSAQYSFTVCGTGEIKKFTLGLRRYIDGIDLETIGEDAGIPNLRQRVERCINIAILYDFSQRICYSLDAPLEYGEFELFEADVDECMNWLLDCKGF